MVLLGKVEETRRDSSALEGGKSSDALGVGNSEVWDRKNQIRVDLLVGDQNYGPWPP